MGGLAQAASVEVREVQELVAETMHVDLSAVWCWHMAVGAVC